MRVICPKCKVELLTRGEDITIGEAPRPPRPGDVAVCSGCGSASILNKEMKMLLLGPEHYPMLPLYTRQALEKLNKRRKQ